MGDEGGELFGDKGELLRDGVSEPLGEEVGRGSCGVLLSDGFAGVSLGLVGCELGAESDPDFVVVSVVESPSPTETPTPGTEAEIPTPAPPVVVSVSGVVEGAAGLDEGPSFDGV